jgi:diacylglycerol kinase (ATP)
MSGVLAILNPSSGRSEPDAVEQALRLRFPVLEVFLRPEEGDLVALVRARIEQLQPELVVVSGGDGTVSAVASAAAGSRVRLAVIPSGTANVLARELGIPLSLEEACDVAAHGVPRAIDAMELDDGRRCLCRVALGVFGQIAEATSTEGKKLAGSLAYAAAAVPLIAHADLRRFELDIDGVATTHECCCIVVTNLSQVGGAGLRWSDDVHPDDGQLDVFVVCSQTLPENLGVLWSALTGDAAASRDVTHLVARDRVIVTCDEEVPFVADGELRHERELRLRCAAAALEVMVPPEPAPAP